MLRKWPTKWEGNLAAISSQKYTIPMEVTFATSYYYGHIGVQKVIGGY